jgi:hypothetical protein
VFNNLAHPVNVIVGNNLTGLEGFYCSCFHAMKVLY